MCGKKFYICRHCGNIIGMIKNSGVPVVCCGEKMQELVANSVDAAVEKHVPVATYKCNKVTVQIGEVEHPMTEAHLIEWVYLHTEQGGQRKCLKAGDAPSVEFALVKGDKPVAVYAYCNLHGLWVKEF